MEDRIRREQQVRKDVMRIQGENMEETRYEALWEG
jgi:hypothetical protein